jgi:probable HAF family extracellular repeat protein
MNKTFRWVRAAVAVAATGAAGLAQAGWVASSVQATTGQTFVQVVNDQGQAAGYVRTTSAGGRGGTVVTNRGFFFDGQSVVNDPSLWALTGAAATDINRSGQVLFGARLYSAGALTTVAGSPVALNDAGQTATIVQVGAYADGVFHAALGQADGSFQDLGLLGGKKSQAKALNNAGQVVGFSQYPGGGVGIHAVLYNGQTLVDLGQLLDPAASSFGTGINDAGTVIGSLLTASGNRAFVYRGGAMSLLALQGSTGVGTTTADAVNAAGQVLGTSCAGVALCEVMLDNQGQISVLGRLAGASTQGVALNDRGQALVSATINGDLDYGLWDHGTMLNLDELVAGLGFTDVAYATLANGFLAGYGTLASGLTQSFLLRDTGSAVPEPASGLLVLGALVALRAARRRGR